MFIRVHSVVSTLDNSEPVRIIEGDKAMVPGSPMQTDSLARRRQECRDLFPIGRFPARRHNHNKAMHAQRNKDLTGLPMAFELCNSQWKGACICKINSYYWAGGLDTQIERGQIRESFSVPPLMNSGLALLASITNPKREKFSAVTLWHAIRRIKSSAPATVSPVHGDRLGKLPSCLQL